MTARSIRRAAERKARKAAEKQVRFQHPTETESVSEARVAANRANAQLSTGPRTPEGKATSSMNAVKTGLTGRTVLLPSDDAEAYRQHLAAYETEFQPVGLRERELVQSLADIQWRLQRIPGLEMTIYARGRDEFAAQFEDLDPSVRSARIDLETFLHYEKPLRNLQLQEGRLRRHREKDLAELRELQEERRHAENSLASIFERQWALRSDRKKAAAPDNAMAPLPALQNRDCERQGLSGTFSEQP